MRVFVQLLGRTLTNLRVAQCRITKFMDATGAICAAFDSLQERRRREVTVTLILNAIIIIEFPFDSRLPLYIQPNRWKKRTSGHLLIKRRRYLSDSISDYIQLSPRICLSIMPCTEYVRKVRGNFKNVSCVSS